MCQIPMAVNKGIRTSIEAAVVSDYFGMMKRIWLEQEHRLDIVSSNSGGVAGPAPRPIRLQEAIT
jgi:hypothetical protein